MKKQIYILVLLFMLSLVGCNGKSQNEEKYSFQAVILELEGTSVLVAPLAGEDILRSSDRISFSSSELDDIQAQIGDIVVIDYSGEIMESYPAQIRALGWSILEKGNMGVEE